MVNDHRLDHDLGRFLQRWPAESVQKSDKLVILNRNPDGVSPVFGNWFISFGKLLR